MRPDLTAATDLGVVERCQQHEIPQVTVRITQYDQHAVRCGCGRVRTAARPDGARSGPVGYGPNLQVRARGPGLGDRIRPRPRNTDIRRERTRTSDTATIATPRSSEVRDRGDFVTFTYYDR